MKRRFYISLLMALTVISSAFGQSMTITGGNDHGVIICSQGFLYGWGLNMGSQGGPYLGIDPDGPDGANATATNVFLPSKIKTGSLSFSQVTAGSGSFTLALACTNVVYAWGENGAYACGQGPTFTGVDGADARTVKYPLPVVKGETEGYDLEGNQPGDYLGGVKLVAANTAQGFALLNDGRVVMWGKAAWQNESDDVKAPRFVRDKSGNIIENVTHISGGDHNVYMRTEDGKLYALGTWNGVNTNSSASPTNPDFASAVLVQKAEDNSPLENIRMSAAGDQCGFAVTVDGYVWGWGNAWGGCNGIGGTSTSVKAKKVVAGDYEQISGESYLTDVTQVIGGRGHGAAITKEGYLLYWGNNDLSDGGVAPDPDATTAAPNGHPIFAFYCKDGTCDQRGDTVKNAVAISRGDNFDFMVNDKDEYYGWGLNDKGQLGIGSECTLVQCLKKIETIPCEIQDVCPSLFIVDQKKCPGEEIELDCGFVVPIGKEESYYIEWYHNGTRLNKPDLTKDVTGSYVITREHLTDKYNVAKLKITAAGEYKVIAYYVGKGVPCGACEPVEETITVEEMEMPIDNTIITELNCVAKPLAPEKSDIISFESVVTDAFYDDPKTKVQLAVFATADPSDRDTLAVISGGKETKVITTTGAGGAIDFTVRGNQIARSEIDDNKDLPSNDTIYHVWVEDITQFETKLMEKSLSDLPSFTFKGPTAADEQFQSPNGPNLGTSNYQNEAMIVSIPTSTMLNSFTVFAVADRGPQYQRDYETKEWRIQDLNQATISITPVIYMGGTSVYGNYSPGKLYKTLPMQTFKFDLTQGIQELVVNCNVELEANPTRGATYIIGAEITTNNCTFAYDKNAFTQKEGVFVNPVMDSENLGIQITGATAQGTTATTGCGLWNLTFGRLTEYDCGRIELSARYGCPPCDAPDLDANGNFVSATVDGSYVEPNADGKKVVEICKESDDVTLNILPLKFETKDAEDGKFEVAWFKGDETFDNDYLKDVASPSPYAVKSSSKGASTTENKYTVTWADVMGTSDKTKDAEMTFYVRVRDMENPESEDCFKYDSVTVIAHPVPTDTIANDTFCVGTLTENFIPKIEGYTISWTTEPTDIMNMKVSADFAYVAVKTETGCKSDPHTYKVIVNSTDAPTFVKQDIPQFKTPGQNYSLSAAYDAADVAEDCIIRWYTSKTAGTPLTTAEAVQPLDEAGEFTFYAEQYNEKTGCLSERVEVVVKVNDSKSPLVDHEHLCVGDEIVDMSVYAHIEKKDETDTDTYELLWYSSLEADKSTADKNAPGFIATAEKAGDNEFYVSQRNLRTLAESERSTVIVTVHTVTELDVTDNALTYCIGNDAEQLRYTKKTGGSFTSVEWSKTADMTNPQTTMTPDVSSAGTTKYYVRAYFDNEDKVATTTSAVCYGEVIPLSVVVNNTAEPKGTHQISYIKDEGAAGGFKLPTKQDEGALLLDDADCELVWYSDAACTIKITEAEATPEYDPAQVGDKKFTYYVKQHNKTTDCYSEPVTVSITVSGYPMPTPVPLSFCERRADEEKISGKLEATINTAGGTYSESEFILVWYTEDPDANPSADEYNEINLEDFDLTIDGMTEKEHDYPFYVRQRLVVNPSAQSAPAKLTVSVYANPILKPNVPEPICKGEEVDLADLYEVSNRAIIKENLDAQYRDAMTKAKLGDSKVGEAGTYEVQGFFPLVGTTETCYSEWKPITVKVDELDKVEIIGDLNTCPNVPLDFSSKLTTNVTDKTRISYSWSTSAGVLGPNETFNTTAAGLEQEEAKVTLQLSVSAGACKNVKADPKTITVGKGEVSGSFTFTESKNARSGESLTASSNAASFASCGGNVMVDVQLAATEDAYTYTADNGDSGNGTFASGSTSFAVRPGTYTINYVNICNAVTKFIVKDLSLEGSVKYDNPELCAGQAFSASVTVDTKGVSEPYSIAWSHDTKGVLPGQTSPTFSINPAKVEDSGAYEYTLSRAGCSFSASVPKIGEVVVKPNVVLDESKLAEMTYYEAVRTKPANMELFFTVPADGADIADGIKWSEDGMPVNVGNKYNLDNVQSDHTYDVKIEPEGYCGTSTKVVLKVDALLVLDAKPTRNEMCVGDQNELNLQMTGTGSVLHPDQFSFRVDEKIGAESHQIPATWKDGLLVISIHPEQDAEYNITYSYGPESQDLSTTIPIRVHQPFQIEWEPTDLRLCEGSSGEIQITKAEPNDGLTTLTWGDHEIIASSNMNGAHISIPEDFVKSGISQRVQLSLVASNGICVDKPYPVYVVVDKQMTGAIEGKEYICEGRNISLDASSYGADEYKWTSYDQFAEDEVRGGATLTLPVEGLSATFELEMKRGSCVLTDEKMVEVVSSPKVDYVDSIDYRKVEVVLVQGTGMSPYRYIIDNDAAAADVMDSEKDGLSYGKHTVHVIDANDCDAVFEFRVVRPEIEFPVHISPNGDKVNDEFYPQVLVDAYPDAVVRIFDRWGKQLTEYKAGDVDSAFDGTYNGKNLPSTDYWYEIEIKEINKTYTGHFTLLRQ